MSIPFNEIVMPEKPKTKEQIMAEMKHTWKRPLTRQPHFFNGGSNGEHVHGKTRKEKLIFEADEAIAWGYADNESTGYSAGQFISLIRQLRDFIKDNVP